MSALARWSLGVGVLESVGEFGSPAQFGAVRVINNFTSPHSTSVAELVCLEMSAKVATERKLLQTDLAFKRTIACGDRRAGSAGSVGSVGSAAKRKKSNHLARAAAEGLIRCIRWLHK